MHNENCSKESWSRQATLGVSAGDQHRVVMKNCVAEHAPSSFFVVRSLLMAFGLCSRGGSQWAVPAPVVQWAIAVSVRSGCLPTIKSDEPAVKQNADRYFFAGIPQYHTTSSFNWVYKHRSMFQKLCF